jgi:lysyl-tRNA synthetase class 2
MMEITEEVVRECALSLTGGLALDYQGQALDFGPPFRRASMQDLVSELTG